MFYAVSSLSYFFHTHFQPVSEAQGNVVSTHSFQDLPIKDVVASIQYLSGQLAENFKPHQPEKIF
jgi:hypothetical protein